MSKSWTLDMVAQVHTLITTFTSSLLWNISAVHTRSYLDAMIYNLRISCLEDMVYTYYSITKACGRGDETTSGDQGIIMIKGSNPSLVGEILR